MCWFVGLGMPVSFINTPLKAAASAAGEADKGNIPLMMFVIVGNSPSTTARVSAR